MFTSLGPTSVPEESPCISTDCPPSARPPSPAEALAPAECGPGSRPETGTVGRTPAEDYASGRAAEGYTCNTRLVTRAETSRGFLGWSASMIRGVRLTNDIWPSGL